MEQFQKTAAKSQIANVSPINPPALCLVFLLAQEGLWQVPGRLEDASYSEAARRRAVRLMPTQTILLPLCFRDLPSLTSLSLSPFPGSISRYPHSHVSKVNLSLVTSYASILILSLSTDLAPYSLAPLYSNTRVYRVPPVDPFGSNAQRFSFHPVN